MSATHDVRLLIDGQWCQGGDGASGEVLDPSSGQVIGHVAHASRTDLDRALAAAARGFAQWRAVSAYERSKVMRQAAALVRERADDIARLMTMEQGKPLAEARLETLLAADLIEWFAEEARRTYGRLVPARAPGVMQMVVKQPVGPVAAFTPWNFPINQAVRKLSAAFAAGCSVILKGPEETPASCAALVRTFADAGVPAGVVNLVFGVPAEISGYLIPHPVIRKVTFTGSTAVGKQLAALAGQAMKRATMELGGHAPAIVCDDADVDAAAKMLAASKFRNAGQVCISPTRFLVQRRLYGQFCEAFTTLARAVKVGNGLEPGTTMGPLANRRRVAAIQSLVEDAVSQGARIATGGERIGTAGNFYAPTVLVDVPRSARIMNEEPFGPVAALSAFDTIDEVIAEANRLPYGLAAYAFTRSAHTMQRFGEAIESGMLTINHIGLGFPEVPFGGMKDSGHGSEGGAEAVEAYLETRFVTQVGL